MSVASARQVPGLYVWTGNDGPDGMGDEDQIGQSLKMKHTRKIFGDAGHAKTDVSHFPVPSEIQMGHTNPQLDLHDSSKC